MFRAFSSLLTAGFALALVLPGAARADETCLSPYMAKIVGQEDYVYVWTLGIEGLGDGQDKLVTDRCPNPASEDLRQGRCTSLSVGGRNEAHHSGLSDDRRYPLGGRSRHQQDLHLRRPHRPRSKPSLRQDRSTTSWRRAAAWWGRTRFYALPGRMMMISGLSNNKDHGGRTALVEYTNER